MNGTPNVLLIDDNKADIELMQYVLAERNGASRFHVLRDGAEALAFLAKATKTESPLPLFALALLDLQLPKISGLEILSEIKKNALTKALPVVVLSSSRQLSDVDESYKRGANAYVQKPVTFEEFSEAIGRIAEFWLDVNLGPSPALFGCLSVDGSSVAPLHSKAEKGRKKGQ